MKKILYIITIILILTLGCGGFYALSLTSSNEILNNVYVNDFDLSGKTKEEAKEYLESNITNTGVVINFKFEEEKYTYDASDLGFGFNIDKAIEDAYMVGRQGSIVEKMMGSLSQQIFNAKEIIQMDLMLKEDKVSEVVNEVADKVEVPAQISSIEINSGKIEVVQASDGIKVDREALEEKVKNELTDIELLRPNLKSEYNFDIPYEKIEVDKSNVDYSKITGIIGEFTTAFDANNKNRTHNIALAASSINNKILMPGEKLSYNQSTGRRTYENGYKDASVIVNGDYEQGVGGGVCQVSSTLYNAALYANLDIVQRRNHSIPTAYTPIARDAVVSYGVLDLVIKNPYDYPIMIKSGVNGNLITVQIYGNVETAPKVTLSSKVIEKVPRNVVYKEDNTLPAGTEKVKDQGRDKIIAEAYKTIDGVTTKISTDVYPAKDKIILKGTK